VYSSSDLKSHNARPHTWGPADLVRKLMSDQGFDAVLENPTSGALETLSQLVCFGSTEICSVLKPGTDLHISAISTLTRQLLCQLLDPTDPMGKDWCLLAVKLGLVDKLPKLDTSSGVLNKASQTARLLDEWEQHTSSKIGDFIKCVEDIGREDVVNALLCGCSLYRIITLEEVDFLDTVDNVKLAAESQRRREDAEALKEFKASQDKFLEEEEKRRKAEALGSVGGATSTTLKKKPSFFSSGSKGQKTVLAGIVKKRTISSSSSKEDSNQQTKAKSDSPTKEESKKPKLSTEETKSPKSNALSSLMGSYSDSDESDNND